MDYLSASLSFGIVRRRVQALVVEASIDLGLSYAEFSLLLVLFDKEGCSQDDMTTFLNVDKAAITRVIKKLEEKEYIFRKQDEADRRLKRIYLTDKGRQQEVIIKNIVRKIMDYLAKDFTPQERDTMIKCLNTMAQNLSRDDYQTVFGSKGA